MYQRIVEPRGPVLPGVTISREEAQDIRRRLGGLLVRWLGSPQLHQVATKQDWYLLLCFQHQHWKDYPTRRRKVFKKAQQKCEARLVCPLFLAQQAYPIYQKAHRRYRNFSGQLEDLQSFRQKLQIEAQFPELIQYIGVFYEEQLVGYSKVYNYDRQEINFAISRYDPDFLKFRSSEVLSYFRNQYFLQDQGIPCLCSGQRNIEHRTNVQEFYVEKFNFRKVPVALNLDYAPVLTVGMKFLRPTQKLVQGLYPRLDSLLMLDRLSR